MVISPKTKRVRKIYRWGISLLSSLVAFIALVLPIALRPDALPLKIGQVSTTTIVAPNNLTYISGIQTSKSRAEAIQNVQPRYLPADPAISRIQIDNLHLTINYIITIRSDTFSSNEQKIAGPD